MKIFYFTSTGNNLEIAKQFNADLFSIPKLLKTKQLNYKAKSIGFIFPCYFFVTPRIVVEFLEKAKFQADYFFAIISYGSFSAGAIHDFKKHAKNNGISVNYINEILMIDNYLPVFEISKEIIKKNNLDIKDKIESIQKDITNKSNIIYNKGIFNRFLSSLFYIFYKSKWDIVDKNFYVDSNCNNCGTCIKVCPVDNIIIDKSPEFKHKCHGCFACIHNCPQNALHDRREKSSIRYRNKNITLKEIIDSNNK